MKFDCTLILFCCFALPGSLAGQPNGKVDYYSTKDGLSHQRVTSILKDKEGFMWFGSWNGINRFDGRAFVPFKSSPGDRFQLRNDRVDQVYDDSCGNLWILAYDKQIYRFNKQTEQFLPLAGQPFFQAKPVVFTKILLVDNTMVWLQTVNDGIFCVYNSADVNRLHIVGYGKGAATGYQLPQNTVNFIKKDTEKGIWMGTSNGLCHLEPTNNGIYHTVEYRAPGTTVATNITAATQDQQAVYFGTDEGNLIIYNRRQRNFNTIHLAEERLNIVLRSRSSSALYASTNGGKIIRFDVNTHQNDQFQYSEKESLHALYEDSKGYLWIEPDKSGVIRFNPFTRSFLYLPARTNNVFNKFGNLFRVIEDETGLVWINLKGGGLGYFDAEQESIRYELKTPDGADFQLPTLVYSIYYDTDGVFWLTTYERELIKIVLLQNSFTLKRLTASDDFQSDKEVRGLCADRQGRIWAGTKSGKLHVYDGDVLVRDIFENQSLDGVGDIYSILQDSQGTIWLGTKRNGLYKATPTNAEQKQYRIAHYGTDKTAKDSLPCTDTYALLEDRQGRIWIGSFDNGLVLIKNEQGKTHFIHSRDLFPRIPANTFNRIRHMELDKEGNIWAATTDGLLIIDIYHKSTKDGYIAYSKIPGDRESLGNNDVQFVLRDSKNRIWLGTSGGGFCEAIGANPFQSLRFLNYTTSEGMPNDYVLSCIEARGGDLWVATENGLTKFTPGLRSFHNYDNYDGVPQAAFSESSVTKRLRDNTLFFGTSDGILSFNPDKVNKKKITANIAITNLHTDNEEAGPGMKKAALEKNIEYLSKVELKYFQNIISIDYAVLDYRFGDQQATAYRLIGFDTVWHDDRQQHRATYTNLAPGHYLFEVRSLSNDLYLNQPVKRLFITILPPPWRTWWAYCLYILAIAVILFYIRRTALSIIRLRNKVAVEQKLAALKLNFFTNVSHELRTPLTLIVNPLEQLAKKKHLSLDDSLYVDVARRNADRMGRFINQLLDLRKVQSEKAVLRLSKVDIIAFVQRIANHFIDVARSKRIDFDVASEETELVAWVDMEKLDVVIYNLLGNAFKFTPDGKGIQIHIRQVPEEQSFMIAVCDRGPGVPKQELEAIFELFHEGYQEEPRVSKGTGIGLALSREFIALHGGTIQATNNKDGGLTVTVKLKTGTNHFQKDKISFVDAPSMGSSPQDFTQQSQLPLFEKNERLQNQEAALVLLVEDNEDLRFFIRQQLSENYRVEVAADGQEGFQKATKLLPDLIVSDIMMPNLDGIQMLDKLKNNLETSHIPVVLLSARYSIESQLEGLKYGADTYITKPFNNELLIASIENLLRQRKKLFQLMLPQKESTIALAAPAPEPSLTPVIITSKDEIFLKEIIKVVEDRMADTDFNIDLMADSMAMSRTTFNKKFKSLTAFTPVEFVRDMRLRYAKEYLDTGDNNVSEVAYRVGFNNPKYFSTCFREKYRISPSDYLKSKGVQS